MNLSRTDLAVETAEALPTGRDMFAPGTGVTKSECLLCGCPVTRIHVHTLSLIHISEPTRPY